VSTTTNKLFFFLNYEGQSTQENQQETMTVPTASMRQGLISYTNAAGTNTTLPPGQFAGMDPHTNPNNSLDVLSTDATMGVYSRTLTAPRVQQFSLRYSF
jgi:hypothetical protein